MTTIELAPCDYTQSPEGILHLISQNPEEHATVCGVIVTGKNAGKWRVGTDATSAFAATCLPCRIELAQRQAGVRLGNYMALEGVDSCQCGGKHWSGDRCINCGAEWSSEARSDD